MPYSLISRPFCKRRHHQVLPGLGYKNIFFVMCDPCQSKEHSCEPLPSGVLWATHLVQQYYATKFYSRSVYYHNITRHQ